MKTIRATLTPELIKAYEKMATELGSSLAKKDKKEKDIQYM
jgi:hypothetical protein